jgi:hypothetical protein
MSELRIIICLGLIFCFGQSQALAQRQGQPKANQQGTQAQRQRGAQQKGAQQKGNRGGMQRQRGRMDRQRGGMQRGGRAGGQDDQSLIVGELAPDFKIKSLDGKTETQLASFKGKKPVVLIFGSYT